ncbi:MAG: hypothetical protein HRU20_29525 [Pseudomonadales bacterium]|nr:hypothetical protein [Pseudomonadales bacterium]
MSTRSRAIEWLKNNYPEANGKLRASKLYSKEESWTKSKVWWFEFSVSDVKNDIRGFSNLLCEHSPGSNDFSLVRVPNIFLEKFISGLYTRGKNGELTFSIYLSANEEDKYTEKKGEGSISLSEYVYEKKFNKLQRCRRNFVRFMCEKYFILCQAMRLYKK